MDSPTVIKSNKRLYSITAIFVVWSTVTTISSTFLYFNESNTKLACDQIIHLAKPFVDLDKPICFWKADEENFTKSENISISFWLKPNFSEEMFRNFIKQLLTTVFIPAPKHFKKAIITILYQNMKSISSHTKCINIELLLKEFGKMNLPKSKNKIIMRISLFS